MSLDNTQLAELRKLNFIGGWEEENNVTLWYRDNGVRKTIKIPNIQRYFCIAREDFGKISIKKWNEYKSRGLYTRGQMQGKYGFIYSDSILYKNNWNAWLTELDDLGVKPLEGDINRLQRLMIDYQLNVAGPDDANPPEWVFFDIETDDSRDKIEIGADRILSVAWIDRHGKENFLALEQHNDVAEEKFLKQIIDILTQYDIRIGYNNYGFDDEVLEARFKKYKIDTTKWKRIASLDMYNLFERQGTFRNYDVRNHKLDTIAKAVLKRGKIEHTEKIIDLYNNDINLLKEYNLEDVRLTYEMEKILGTVGLVLSASSFAGLLHSLNYSPAKTVDVFLLRSAQKRRMAGGFDFRYATSYYRPEHSAHGKFSPFTRNALPSDKRKGRKELLEEEYGIDYEPVLGALVLEAEPGLYENVHAFDFQSLYPNMVRAFNIGHDTLVNKSFDGPKNQAPNGIYYRTDVTSAMSEGITFLINKRKEIRAGAKLEVDQTRKTALDILQRGIKELTNSFYGVTAQYGGRYYSKDIAESITSSGRTFLPYGDEFLSSRGHKVVIGDTDSLYVAIKSSVAPDELIQEYLNSLYDHLKTKYNVYQPEYLKMSYEKSMSRVLIVAKKLYSAWVTMEDGKPVEGHLVNKGLSLLKGNYPKWGSEICLEILTDLLSGRSDDPNHYIRIILREKELLSKGEIDWHKLLISARLGKRLDEYENENALPHVRIARRLAAQGKQVNTYSTISYLVTDGDLLHNKIDGLAEEEVTADTTYDACYYFNHQLMKQVESLLEPKFPMIDFKELLFPKNYVKHPYRLDVKIKGL